MSWKDIVKEDLTEKVISALIPFYGSRKEVLSSNIIGAATEGELYLIPPYTKDDVKSLIEDMDFAATSYDEMERKDYQETRNQLKRLL